METGYLVIVAVLAIFILAALATIIYMAAYRHYLSKCIAEGITSGTKRKTLILPVRFFGITALVLCLATVGIMLLGSIRIEPAQSEQRISTELSECREDGIAGFLSSNKEIGGYTRHETQSGSFHFVYYMRNDDSEGFPTLLLNIECDKSYEYAYQFKELLTEYCNTSDGYIQGGSNWYAVTAENFNGTLTLEYRSGDENTALEIEMKKVD